MLPHGSGFSSPWTTQKVLQNKQVLEISSVIPAWFCAQFNEESPLGYLRMRSAISGCSGSFWLWLLSHPVWDISAFGVIWGWTQPQNCPTSPHRMWGSHCAPGGIYGPAPLGRMPNTTGPFDPQSVSDLLLPPPHP